MKRVAPLWAVLVIAVALVGIGSGANPASVDPSTYDTPGTYSYTVPAGIASVVIDVYGAAGGNAAGYFTNPGGLGGHMQAAFSVTEGEVLDITVAAAGSHSDGSGAAGGAGFGGSGGRGGNSTCCADPSDDADGGGGGGASAVVADDGPLLLVAGGGGGGAPNANGGAGGGDTGGPGAAPSGFVLDGTAATPGSQSAVGSGGQAAPSGGDDHNGNNGEDSSGGDGADTTTALAGGGGGGGYTGGGGGGTGTLNGGSGAGGSGYVDNAGTAVTKENGVQLDDGKVVITPVPAATTTTELTTSTSTSSSTTTSTSTTSTSTTSTSTSSTTSTTTTTPAALPTVRLTSPNGGESWACGTTHAITWKFSNVSPSATVKIVLVQNTHSVLTIATNQGIGTAGNGSRSWTIPTSVPAATNYRIRISINGTSPVRGDNSNASFRIA